MIELPENFKRKIINRYNKIGINWLNNIDLIANKYINMFDLKKVKVLDDLSMNIVLTAESEKLGDVIIKIGAPGITSHNEILYINLLPLKNMVKCFYYNINDRVMILEKIFPGYSLNKVENIDERIKIFKNLLNDICVNNGNCLNKFPTYNKKLEEKLKEANEYADRSKYIIELLNNATNMYEEITKLNLPKYVLHGDLQHKNILKFQEGWKIIDPQGNVGEIVFDTCQFIKYEMENNDIDLNIIVEKVANAIDINKKLIYKALYIEIATKILFYLKAGYSEEFVTNNINLCKILIKHIL